MHLAILTFTYSEDAQLVAEMDRALVRLRKDNPSVRFTRWIIDDANSPIPSAEKPDCDVYMKTSYNRGGNLMGLENFYGMLGVYEEVAKTGVDAIIKIDSDCVLNHIGWIPSEEVLAECGQVGCVGRGGFCNGPCYAITPGGVEAVRKALAMPGIVERITGGKVQEDVTFTPLVRLGGKTVYSLKGRINHPFEGGDGHCWVFHDYSPDYERLLYTRSACSFKNYSRWRDAAQKKKDRDEALARMKRYVDHYLASDFDFCAKKPAKIREKKPEKEVSRENVDA